MLTFWAALPARLFFYGERYAGTWELGTVGGRMSGQIEKRARIP
jgi:hypothetical protein